jgi:hypothetical protein
MGDREHVNVCVNSTSAHPVALGSHHISPRWFTLSFSLLSMHSFSFKADLPCGRRGEVNGASLVLIARPSSGEVGTIWNEDQFYDRNTVREPHTFLCLPITHSDGSVSAATIEPSCFPQLR